ncbi:septum formation initiator family protein [Atopobium fossor]|uniref:septum formation initiator family protein n=1 Tax=Atopobium fossor TaxID=39487 RepID=UPI000488E6A3|nr:septum formation initiator family protein [Atopobium fossor]
MASADDTISFKAQKGGKGPKMSRPKASGPKSSKVAAKLMKPAKSTKDTKSSTPQLSTSQNGRIHAEKRATRKGEKSSTKLNQLLAWYSNLGKHRGLFLVLGGVLLVVVALYAPTRSWYSAQRDAALYTKQLQTLKEDNAALQENVTRLQSKEGIEDEARKRGYVGAGETSVTINGMSDGNSEAKTDASKNSLDGVTTDDPWYIKVLDGIFFYKPPVVHE